MDFCRNISVAGGGLPSEYQPEQLLSSSNCSTKLGSLDDLFSSHNMVEGDMGLEWLSIFVEDCFSSTGNCLPLPTNTNHELQKKTNDKDTTSKSLQSEKTQKNYPTTSSTGSSLRKARSKRKRGGSSLTKSKTQLSSIWSHHNHPLDQNSSDPPLLHQAYWLADSELILPKKKTERAAAAGVGGGEEEEGGAKDEEEVVVGNRGSLEGSNGQQQQGLGQQGRRCSHCQSHRTPQWRAGPKGPKTLCNACGVRYKSGRLLPEYRPAKSPTFVSYKHSNSHRKVLEMRNTTTVMAPIPRQLL